MKGISLIELLMVMVIIGVLASATVPAYKHYTERAKAATVVEAMHGIVLKVKDHYNALGSFPNAGDLGFIATNPPMVDDPTSLIPNATLLTIDGGYPSTGCKFGTIQAKVALGDNKFYNYRLILYTLTGKNIITSVCLDSITTENGSGGVLNETFSVYAKCPWPSGTEVTVDNFNTFFMSGNCTAP